MAKWEYFRFYTTHGNERNEINFQNNETNYSEENLNNILAKLGQEGWELVNVAVITGSIYYNNGRDSYIGRTSETYIFKRPLAG